MDSTNLTAWFKLAIKAERWKDTAWVTRCFCVTDLPNMNDIEVDLENPPEAYELFTYLDNKSYCYWDPTENSFIPFKQSNVIQPLLTVNAPIDLNAGDLPNVKENIKTTVGNVIVNLYVLVYAFGSKLPFVAGKVKHSAFESLIQGHNSTPNLPEDQKLTPEEFDKFKFATQALVTFASITNASLSYASLTVDPKVIELRDKLLKEHKDELTNPAVVANISKQLVELDTKLREGDVSDDFFMDNKKLQSVGRAKQLIMYGLEGGLDGNLQLIEKSLSEGMDYELLPLYADATTAASQSRGLLTARGGEFVNLVLKVMQNSRVVGEDCGTTRGLSFKVTKENSRILATRRMLVNGKTITITKDMVSDLIGKTIVLRSPGYCLQGGRDFCAACLDSNVATRPDGIATIASKGSSVIMNDAMKKMHGSVAESFDYIMAEHIS